jgi:rRNA processing protein Gar1
LKPLGKFSHITKAGNIVLRGQEIPNLYSDVTDGKKVVGKVHDIIGPATKPYIIVKPNKGLGKTALLRMSKGVFYESLGRRTRIGKKSGIHRRLSGVSKQEFNKRL